MPRGRPWLLPVLSMYVAMPAKAARWSHVTEAASGAEVAIDLDVLELKDGWGRVWVRHDFGRPRPDKARYLIMLQEINCNARALRIVSSAFVASDGTVVSSDDEAGDYRPVVPGSVNEGVGKAVCALGVARSGK